MTRALLTPVSLQDTSVIGDSVLLADLNGKSCILFGGSVNEVADTVRR